MYYENKGDTAQANVIAKDFMAKGMTYQAGTLKIYNASNPNGLALTNADNLFNGTGLNFGNYMPKSNAGLFYTFQTPTNDQLTICGKNIFRNRAVVYTPNGNLEDMADVVVVKTGCTPEKPTPNQPTPNRPGELPSTGPAEIAISMIGLLLITASIIYWYKSQQEIKKRVVSNGTIEMKIDDKTTPLVAPQDDTKKK